MKKTFLALLSAAVLLPSMALAEGNGVAITKLKKSGALKTMGAGVVGKAKGGALIRKGKAKVKKGEANKEKGRNTNDNALVEKGTRQVTKGRKLINAGQRQKKAGGQAIQMGKGMIKSKFQKKTQVTEEN